MQKKINNIFITDTKTFLKLVVQSYFNNYNFGKAQIIRSLMMVIEPKHVGAVLM
jgi:hypothetical protein